MSLNMSASRRYFLDSGSRAVPIRQAKRMAGYFGLVMPLVEGLKVDTCLTNDWQRLELYL